MTNSSPPEVKDEILSLLKEPIIFFALLADLIGFIGYSVQALGLIAPIPFISTILIVGSVITTVTILYAFVRMVRNYGQKIRRLQSLLFERPEKLEFFTLDLKLKLQESVIGTTSMQGAVSFFGQEVLKIFVEEFGFKIAALHKVDLLSKKSALIKHYPANLEHKGLVEYIQKHIEYTIKNNKYFSSIPILPYSNLFNLHFIYSGKQEQEIGYVVALQIDNGPPEWNQILKQYLTDTLEELVQYYFQQCFLREKAFKEASQYLELQREYQQTSSKLKEMKYVHLESFATILPIIPDIRPNTYICEIDGEMSLNLSAHHQNKLEIILESSEKIITSALTSCHTGNINYFNFWHDDLSRVSLIPIKRANYIVYVLIIVDVLQDSEHNFATDNDPIGNWDNISNLVNEFFRASLQDNLTPLTSWKYFEADLMRFIKNAPDHQVLCLFVIEQTGYSAWQELDTSSPRLLFNFAKRIALWTENSRVVFSTRYEGEGFLLVIQVKDPDQAHAQAVGLKDYLMKELTELAIPNDIKIHIGIYLFECKEQELKDILIKGISALDKARKNDNGVFLMKE